MNIQRRGFFQAIAAAFAGGATAAVAPPLGKTAETPVEAVVDANRLAESIVADLKRRRITF